MGWIEYRKDAEGYFGEQIEITKAGKILLPQALLDTPGLAGSKYIDMSYDFDRASIGLRFAPVSRQRSFPIVRLDQYGASIACRPFLEWALGSYAAISKHA